MSSIPTDWPACWTEAGRIHENLSPLAGRFLEFVQHHPEALERPSYELLVRENPLKEYSLQPWPTLVDARLRDEMSRAIHSVSALLRDVPRRAFDYDPDRVSRFYGIPKDRAALACEILADGDYAREVIARGDFVFGPEGFQCIELNMSSTLGGWQVGLWGSLYQRVPTLQRFFQETGSSCRVTDPVYRLFLHLVGLSRPDPSDGDATFDIAFLGDAFNRQRDLLTHYANGVLRSVLRATAPELSGQVLVCRGRDLKLGRDGLRLGDHRIRAVVNHAGFLDRTVFFAWMSGAVAVFNAVVDEVLGDKRNLALLSEEADAGRLSEGETATVQRHLPWSRLVQDAEVTRHGDTAFLPELVREEREHLVLKPGRSWGGKSVYIGAACSDEEWDRHLERALDRGGWIVQERVPAYRLLCQSGDSGCAWHDVVWGAFHFGGEGFDGGFVRLSVSGGTGAVNVAQGAQSGPIFEVEETADG